MTLAIAVSVVVMLSLLVWYWFRSRPAKIQRENERLEFKPVLLSREKYGRRLLWNLYLMARRNKKAHQEHKRRAVIWRREVDKIFTPEQKREIRRQFPLEYARREFNNMNS